MSTDEAQQVLASLRSVRQDDNVFVSLVHEQSGKWWALDV